MRMTALAVTALLTLHGDVSVAKPPREPVPDRMPLPGATMPQHWLPVDDTGWTMLKPAADSRILYVSNDWIREGFGVERIPTSVQAGNDRTVR